MNIVEKIEAYSDRLDRAKRIVRDDEVAPPRSPDAPWRVRGHEVAGFRANDRTCDCQDFKIRGKDRPFWCKHLLAVELFEMIRRGERTYKDL